MLTYNISKLQKYIWLIFFITFDANAWIIEQNYDNQSLGGKCEKWGSSQSTVSSDKSASGSKSCKQIVSINETAFGKWGGVINTPENVNNGGEIWIRVRAYWPTGFNYDSSTSALKFLRIHTRDSVNTNYGYNDWYMKTKSSGYASYFRYEGEPYAKNHAFGRKDDKIQTGVWETYEFYVKLDTTSVDNGGQAMSRMWKNGKLIGEITATPTMKKTQGYVDRIHIFTYWNGGSPQTQHMYIDDVTITSNTPGTKDAAGNSYIGVDDFTQTSPPKPPEHLNSP